MKRLSILLLGLLLAAAVSADDRGIRFGPAIAGDVQGPTPATDCAANVMARFSDANGRILECLQITAPAKDELSIPDGGIFRLGDNGTWFLGTTNDGLAVEDDAGTGRLIFVVNGVESPVSFIDLENQIISTNIYIVAGRIQPESGANDIDVGQSINSFRASYVATYSSPSGEDLKLLPDSGLTTNLGDLEVGELAQSSTVLTYTDDAGSDTETYDNGKRTWSGASELQGRLDADPGAGDHTSASSPVALTATSDKYNYPDTTTADVEYDLPLLSSVSDGAIFDFKIVAGANNVILDPNGTENIEGASASHSFSGALVIRQVRAKNTGTNQGWWVHVN